MPGVLIIEAMAQAGAIIMMHEIADREKKLAVFTGIERAKFRRPVTPGDQLRIEVDVLAFKSRLGRMEAKAFVEGKLACQATLTCQIVPKAQSATPEPQPAPEPQPVAEEGGAAAETVSAE
jgi:3-hydroxyacyl-[acyl-carrier-protein] dehydratase